jgi:23S rRNA pseudouridine2605 synthase
MTLNEGKNREIRKILEALGLRVTRLIRISYGPFDLANLRRGMVEEVPIRNLPRLLPGYFGSR